MNERRPKEVIGTFNNIHDLRFSIDYYGEVYIRKDRYSDHYNIFIKIPKMGTYDTCREFALRILNNTAPHEGS